MPIKNGKIVGRKLAKEEKKPKGFVEEQKQKASKKLRDKALGKKENPIKKGFEEFKKESMKPKKPKKSKKAAEDFIRTGANGAIKIEASEFNGESVVAIRKMYCTKTDPEMKIGKGGFNLPSDPDVLDSVIAALQEIRDNL